MKRIVAILGVAIAGSQAGHLLAYTLRFGVAAQQVESSGAHAYFPLLAKTLIGAAAVSLLASLVIAGFARLASGRRLERQSAPSLLRLLAALYTVQLVFFVVQETLEGGQASQLFLWGLAGQLPVAFLGAAALRWLLATLAPALAGLAQRWELAVELLPVSAGPVLRPSPAAVSAADGHAAGPITRRGPPPSF